jgi:hypothetical protein
MLSRNDAQIKLHVHYNHSCSPLLNCKRDKRLYSKTRAWSKFLTFIFENQTLFVCFGCELHEENVGMCDLEQ